VKLPTPRGALSGCIAAVLGGSGRLLSRTDFASTVAGIDDPVGDADFQLALACCYELHYRGFDDIADELEWDPVVLSYRALLEAHFENSLRAGVSPPERSERVGAISDALVRLIDSDNGPSLSTYLMKLATVEQFRRFVCLRSVYHLKEADPHTWAIPRLFGATKAALVEIQADEYGGGRPASMHSALFAQTMRALDLDDSYGAYWHLADGPTFAVSNMMTMFGLHRRLRGAAIGHLAIFEMTSTSPNRRYGNGLRRLGFGRSATEFYDVHVEADAVHEQIASVDMCGSFLRVEPSQYPQVLFGAACALRVEARFTESLLSTWGFEPTRRRA
jgi:heme oxygenase-like protein